MMQLQAEQSPGLLRSSGQMLLFQPEQPLEVEQMFIPSLPLMVVQLGLATFHSITTHNSYKL
jgi:hypothetical protein